MEPAETGWFQAVAEAAATETGPAAFFHARGELRNPQTVELFESDTGWNASGGPELMIGKSRHARMFVVAFADGSVQQLRESQLATLRWDP